MSLTPGYETWISLGATVVETAPDFDDMDQRRRKCFMQSEDPFRNDPMQYFEVIILLNLSKCLIWQWYFLIEDWTLIFFFFWTKPGFHCFHVFRIIRSSKTIWTAHWPCYIVEVWIKIKLFSLDLGLWWIQLCYSSSHQAWIGDLWLLALVSSTKKW